MLFTPPQSRHPERSAARIYRIADGLWRGVFEPVLSVAEGTPEKCLSCLCRSELFNHRSPRTGSCYRTHLMVTGTLFMRCDQVCARSLNSGLMVEMRLSFFSRRQPFLLSASGKECGGFARCGFRWLRSSERHRQDKHFSGFLRLRSGQALRLRAISPSAMR